MKVKKKSIKKLVKKVAPIQNVSASVPQDEPSEYERKKVLEVLKRIRPGIASKNLVESMTYFFLSGNNIVTYNDRISILHPFKTQFSAFVKADTFYNLMVKSSVEKFHLLRTGEKVFVKAKGLRVNIPVIIDEVVINKIKSVEESLRDIKWYPLPENFAECVNLCSFAASTSESESTLSCVRIDGKICIASDNNRIATADLDKKMKPMFIKASEVGKLIGIDPISYSESKAWLHFKNKEGCIFSIRIIKGEYPDFLPHFDFEGDNVNLPQNLTEGTDLASIFASELDKPSISITILKNKCKLSVKSEGGNLDFFTTIEYSGDRLEFTINPDFLLEMMKFSTSVVFVKGKAKLETDNFSLLTSLYEE